jgi:hypothetical protein
MDVKCEHSLGGGMQNAEPGIRTFPEGTHMPEKATVERARKDLRQGKSPTTAAGEFVRQEMHHIREGKHGAKNAKQAIAIGLSEARRAGVPIPDKGGGSARATRGGKSSSKRDGAKRSAGSSARSSTKRARASLKALKREPRSAASHRALSRQARSVAKKKPASARSAAARKAARTRARAGR